MTLTFSIRLWCISLHFHIPEYNLSNRNKSFHFFPFKCLWNQNWPCNKLCKGQPRSSFYINFDLSYGMFNSRSLGIWMRKSEKKKIFFPLLLYSRIWKWGYLHHIWKLESRLFQGCLPLHHCHGHFQYFSATSLVKGGALAWASDSGARGRSSPCCFLEQDTFTSQKFW